MVNTTQQIGGSVGTALLNTIAATAAASFLLSNPPAAPTPEAIGAAQAAAAVDGFGTAFMWAAVIFGIATVVSLVLINAGKHQVADIEPMPGV